MPFVRAALLLLLIANVARAETLRVGVAISLKEAVTAIAKTYEAESGDKVEFVFGASGQIATQIKSGAPIDVFISAANKQVDDLAKDKLIDASTRQVVARNALVLIVPADSKLGLTQFADLANPAVKKVAIGEPKIVPAGQYARQTFDALKLSDKLKDRLLYGTNVRQVLTYVESGNVSAGVVYATDAKESGDKVKVVATADEKLHESIIYPAVTVSASKQQDAGKRFLKTLIEDKAQAVLKSKGFLPAADHADTAPASK